MRLYLDTEFNGFGGELISLALVPQTGGLHPVLPKAGVDAAFYEVCLWQEQTDPWVQQNVVPKLEKKPLPVMQFRSSFHDWIKHWINPEIICDWHADAQHFCSLLAGRDYGSSLDLGCTITILRTPPGCPTYSNPHNALADALALREWHESLMASAA